MNTSIREPGSRRYRDPIICSSLVAVFACLTLVGCDQGQARLDEQEARIAELENQLAQQERKIQFLAAAVTRSSATVFDSPLRRFFEAPEFWEVVYEDVGACHNRCHDQFQNQHDACEGDRDCEIDAAIESADCHDECDGPL